MTDALASDLNCSNVECRISENGKCVEGRDPPSGCPTFGKLRTVADGDAEAANVELPTIELSSADRLSASAAQETLRSARSVLVAIVGPWDAGKTSLIASIYELLQLKGMGEVEFARSRTLHAFEIACHDVREASKRAKPHSAYTPRGNLGFFHLELAGGAAGERLTLLLADRSGEDYREIADDLDLAGAFPEVQRADVIAVLVDGRRLIDIGARHQLQSDIMMMLQGIHDLDLLERKPHVAVILTKSDLVADAERDRVHQDFASLIARIKRIFGDACVEIEACAVAASPGTNAMERGSGVRELVTRWLERVPRIEAPSEVEAVHAERAFARLEN